MTCIIRTWLLTLQLKRVNGTHLRIGNRTSGLQFVNHESLSQRIGRSKTKNRLQSEKVNSRWCEPSLGANQSTTPIIIISHYYPVQLMGCVLLRVRLLLGLRAAAKPELRATSNNRLDPYTNMAKTIRVPRSAITGRFVTMRYAETHPATTVVEKVKVGPTKKQK